MARTQLDPGRSREAAACCPPVRRAPISQEVAEQVTPVLKAVADPVRLRLLSLVAAHEGGEACACDLQDAFSLSQPTLSHHLNVLAGAGLLTREKRGTWVYYAVADDTVDAVAGIFGTSPR